MSDIELEISYTGGAAVMETNIIHGNVGMAMVFVDVLMCTKQPFLHSLLLLLLLLRSLSFIDNREIAQQVLHCVACIFCVLKNKQNKTKQTKYSSH